MKILIDAQLPPAISRWLMETYDIRSDHVFDLDMIDADDEAIWEHAKTYGYEIMTKDRDFIDLSLRKGTPPKIIWLTCGNTTTAQLRELLTKTLDSALEILEHEDRVEIG